MENIKKSKALTNKLFKLDSLMNMDVYGGMGDIGVSDLKELWDTELDTVSLSNLELNNH